VPQATLERRLGPGDAAAIVVSNVIGSGILFLPAIVASIAPNPWAMLGVWSIGGLLAFAGAMAYAELAALKPKSGGEYVYLQEAFGPLPAFLTGWTSFVAGFSGAIAATSVAFAGFLGRFVPWAADSTPFFSFPYTVELFGSTLRVIPLALSPQTLVALGLIAVLTVIHVLGLGPGRVVQNLLAVIKFSALFVFVVAGMMWGRGSFEHFTGGEAVAPSAWLLALVLVMFSYSGWNAASYIAEEVRDPGRNVPRALALGTVAVIVIYLAMNILYLYALPVAEMRTLSVRVVDAAAERLFGPFVANIVTLFSMLIAAGSVSAMVFAGPRVYYAMARDGLFFASAARVHPTWHTPATSIIAQSCFSALLVISGTLDQLANYTGFALVLFSSIAVTGLFVLRSRRPNEPRPFRALGYPVAPAVFALVGYAIVLNSLYRDPASSGLGLLVIGVGVPLYFLFARRRSAQAPAASSAASGSSSTISNQ
jgi:APA family basic amino acid/polyamine antiporter